MCQCVFEAVELIKIAKEPIGLIEDQRNKQAEESNEQHHKSEQGDYRSHGVGNSESVVHQVHQRSADHGQYKCDGDISKNRTNQPEEIDCQTEKRNGSYRS